MYTCAFVFFVVVVLSMCVEATHVLTNLSIYVANPQEQKGLSSVCVCVSLCEQ